MKRCPKCSRTFPDENQKFCTFDGGLLMAERPAPPAFDPNLTVRSTSKDLAPPADASEAPTSVRLPDLNATIASVGMSTFTETASTPRGEPNSDDLAAPPLVTVPV